MEPVRIRDDVDPNSPEYRRNFIIVIAIVVVLTLTGGTCLGYRIRSMEAIGGGGSAAKVPGETERPNQQKRTEQPNRPPLK